MCTIVCLFVLRCAGIIHVPTYNNHLDLLFIFIFNFSTTNKPMSRREGEGGKAGGGETNIVTCLPRPQPHIRPFLVLCLTT